MAEQWLTVKAAAALWGVTPQTIRKWVKHGLIDAVQFTPRCWRIPIITEDRHDVQEQGHKDVGAK